jgi:tol-pal system protein YbgF
MMRRFSPPAAVMATLVALLVARPASAANKEHQQLMADLRILQEQSQILQNMVGTLADAIKAVNTRLDQQAEANRRAVADEKLLVEMLTNDLRVVREKVDDNNVRVGSLSQEVDALRQLMQQAIARMTAPVSTDSGAPAGTPGVAATPPAAGAALAGASPTKTYDEAFGDYARGLWDLSIAGFEAFLRDFPTSIQASNAQFLIGRAYMNDGQYEKAVDAFDKVIRNYPMAASVPDSIYLKGESLRNLKQADRAKEAYDTVIKNYPDSSAAGLAKQRITK